MSMKKLSTKPCTEISTAWAAGFLDGNGCVSISKHHARGRKNKTYRLWIRVVQTSEETLMHFQELLNTPSMITLTVPKNQQHKRIYALVYEGRHALSVLKKLRPYLILKADQAESAAQFWQEGRMGISPGPRGFDEDVWKTREYWFQELRRK